MLRRGGGEDRGAANADPGGEGAGALLCQPQQPPLHPGTSRSVLLATSSNYRGFSQLYNVTRIPKQYAWKWDFVSGLRSWY